MIAPTFSPLRIGGTATIGLLAVLTVLTSPQLRSQTATTSSTSQSSQRPVFEVASIKSSSSNQGTFLRRQPGGLYRAMNVSVRNLIATAYLAEFPPKGERIVGGPGWIDTEHFDIEAKATGDPSREEENLMLQSLLEDRFKLVTHHDTRRLPIYALVVSKTGKTGPQLMPYSGDAPCTEPSAGAPPPQARAGEPLPSFCGGFFTNARNGVLRSTGNGITMEMLAQFLNPSVDRTVVDRTGLSGEFDFALEFAPDIGPGSQFLPSTDGASDPLGRPGIFTALQEQLGLKLEAQTGPLDVLVIDRVEEPAPN